VRLCAFDAKTWHPQVRALQIETPDGQVLGHLFLDLYARQGKQSGAWVDSERNRRKTASHIQTPIVYLTCNFSAPQNGKLALLTHDDVITLFHESGHALHALLSQVDEPAAAAFASVEWDAIELPSQFMENFCWEWPVIQALSAHVDSGKPLPRPLYDSLLAAKNFQSGLQTVRQVEFSLFDMSIHNQSARLSIHDVLHALDQVRKEVAVIFPPSWHRFAHSFSHLFAGGYGAGYYSYKWAEVLSADAYAAFEEAAARNEDQTRETLDPPTGLRFRDEILAVGGARPAAESFHAFRGRKASIEALLRHSGMAGGTKPPTS
jgi:oligopeptidase A